MKASGTGPGHYELRLKVGGIQVFFPRTSETASVSPETSTQKAQALPILDKEGHRQQN